MTVKTETNFYKSLKKCLQSGRPDLIITRIESYVTPGFPDCLIYYPSTGFFTIELKVIRRRKNGTGKLLISPLQMAWHAQHDRVNAPVYIMVWDPDARSAKLFQASKLPELRQNSYDTVTGELWAGILGPAQLQQMLELLETPKLPQNSQNI
tara:strand:+ start:574 stop:1029 length:456 start_codon:yes stop_codon:yes gene_type:complete